MDKGTTANDLYRFLDGKTNILTYEDLYKYYKRGASLLDLMKDNSLIIMYNTSDRSGHWCCVTYHPDLGRISFFDPYGHYKEKNLGYAMSDKQFKFIDNKVNAKYHQKEPILTKMMMDTGLDYEFNDMKMQKESEKIGTCGYHCAMRIIGRHMPLDEYQQFMKALKDRGFDLDKLVYFAFKKD